MNKFPDTFQSVFQNIYDNTARNNRFAIATATATDFALESDSQLLKSDSNQIAIPSSNIQEQYQLQHLIRPIFGKKGINKSVIGTHPDFIQLEAIYDQAIRHYICTIFIDLKSSTRLALLYDLSDVVRLKNAFITTCIDTVRAFDGHVHRLMGDAVMGFFGGGSVTKEDAIIDAINCATTLHFLFNNAIIPWMNKEGYDSTEIGFRIGLDFGDDDNVLWASYGYDSVSEITATGLQVDMASKLQGHARENQAMLGQTLLDYIDWPEEYSLKKTETLYSLTKEINYVEPNITDKNGIPINYKMRMLNFRKLLNLSPLISEQEQQVADNIKHYGIRYDCHIVYDGKKDRYISMSKFLQKHISLTFTINVRTHGLRYHFPLKVTFTKTNFGKEAGKEAREFEPIIREITQNNDPRWNPATSMIEIPLNEATLYRGLHTMKAEVIDSNGNTIFKDWIGVLIV